MCCDKLTNVGLSQHTEQLQDVQMCEDTDTSTVVMHRCEDTDTSTELGRFQVIS